MDQHEELRRKLVKAAGTHARAAKVLRLLAREDITNRAWIPGGWLEYLAREIEAMDEEREPRVDDAVILRGTIAHLIPDLGEAVVSVHRAVDSQWITVQAGALEHDTAAGLYDGGVPEQKAGR
jgi:hypothetical protein